MTAFEGAEEKNLKCFCGDGQEAVKKALGRAGRELVSSGLSDFGGGVVFVHRLIL